MLPISSFILLTGWSAIGLPPVDTSLWGGILVTIVVASVGIVFSLPLGILLALGRRSRMPAVRLFSVIFIGLIVENLIFRTIETRTLRKWGMLN